ncbi:hypothetical protein GCM10022251_25390 [Phytohabitans flavus]|uniref:Uncharacterized protein n=1 Tax=Phytohabitans flavus TaxID=1076124 RepID=A0A6F8XR23_9ACTN|nr:hypothetical protein [Phytohabitans flavus]BCB76257.1 hypothetical protein Pflav_026670 [Phytohabitans flavus]
MTVTGQQIAAVTAADVPALFNDFTQDLEKLREFLRKAPELIAEFEKWANDILWWLSWWEWAQRELKELFDSLLPKAKEILQRVKDLVEDAFAPLAMHHDIQLWLEIHKRAQSISESTELPDFPHMEFQGTAASSSWNGPFADAYKSQVVPQHMAAERLAVVAKDTANTLSKVFAASVAVYAAWAALAFHAGSLLTKGWRQWLRNGQEEWRTLTRLLLQATAAEGLANTISRDEGKLMTTVASGRPGMNARDVAWPNPFRAVEFARPRIGPDGKVILEGGAPAMRQR